MHRTIMRAFEQLKEDPQQTPETQNKKQPRKNFNILYRIEQDKQNNLLRIIVQSTVQPNWNNITQKYPDYLIDETTLKLQYQLKPYETKIITDKINNIKNGQQFRFFTEVNATQNIKLEKILQKNIQKETTDDLFLEDENNSENQNNTHITQQSNTLPSSKNTNDHQNSQQDTQKKRIRLEIRNLEDQIKWLKRKAEQGGFKINTIISIDDKPHLITGKKKNGQNKPTNPHKITIKTIKIHGILEVVDAEKFKITLKQGIGKAKAFGCGLITPAPAK